MKIEVLTIFPEIFSGFMSSSLVAKAEERGLLELKLTNIRDFSQAPHFRVDDSPYGGSPGMLMKPEPLALAIQAAKKRLPQAKVILLTPVGRVFKQKDAQALSLLPEVIFVCGRYEGVDQRLIDIFIDEQISIGDFILMGGEVAALVVIEASLRLVPEVLGNADSKTNESFEQNLLEAPQYTRPAEFMGREVPAVLRSGNHQEIEAWRKQAALELTKKMRPDLLE